MNKLLFKQIDNTGLVLWRIVFGALIAIEGYGAIATGWVRRTLVAPEFTFNFIGFEFLQPLPGDGMYYYFALMGTFGVFVMLGFRYRWSMAAYALMWSGVYLMQKSSYNNHYYLMMLLCWIMVFLPAHKWFSLDAWLRPSLKKRAMPRWVLIFIIAQIWIVYTYASVAKLYPDWLDTTIASLFMRGKADYWLIGPFLQLDWVHWCITYVGILFDLLIVPLLLWKRTRLLGFIISIFFHLFNSVVFQIGIFPYMSIAFALFFFTPELLRKRFLPKKPPYQEDEIIVPSYKPVLLTVIPIYLLIQLLLPLRHWTFEDDVLWTEEGHRLSWRMMLRSKRGSLNIFVVDKATQERSFYKYAPLLTKKQQRAVKTKPDMIWQLVQRIEAREAAAGRDVEVYVDSRVKVNGGKYFKFIDPTVDLAAEPWHHFKHHDWILPSPADYHSYPEAEEPVQK